MFDEPSAEDSSINETVKGGHPLAEPFTEKSGEGFPYTVMVSVYSVVPSLKVTVYSPGVL